MDETKHSILRVIDVDTLKELLAYVYDIDTEDVDVKFDSDSLAPSFLAEIHLYSNEA